MPSTAGNTRPNFTGLYGTDVTATISADGTGTFTKEVVAGVRDVDCVLMTSAGTTQGVSGGVVAMP